ncbi:hypothetical protein N7333_09530, partial [Pseudomonas sp. GD04158]
LIKHCQAMAVLHPEFAPLLKSLAKAARSGADADVRIRNLMRRPSAGELVWIDPLFGASYLPDEQSLERLMSIRRSLGMIQTEH